VPLVGRRTRAVETVAQDAYDLSQFVLVDQKSVDLLSHLSDLRLLTADLHLLNDYYQECSKDGDDDQKRPEPEAEPWSSINFHHGDCSISRTECGLNAR